MCRSIETSLLTFFVSVASAGYICKRANQEANPPPPPVGRRHLHWLAAFIVSFASIQLIDAALWYTVHHRLRRTNHIISAVFLPIVLMSELLVAYYGALYAGARRWISYEIALWIFVIAGGIAWYRNCRWTEPCVADDGYLLWCGGGETLSDRRESPIPATMRFGFLLFLVAPFAMHFPNGPIRTVLLGGVLFTFALSYWHATFGTRWCWTSNAISLAVAMILWYGDYHHRCSQTQAAAALSIHRREVRL